VQNYLKITDSGFAGQDPRKLREFKPGDIVSRSEFDEEVRSRQAWQKKLQEENKNFDADLIQIPKAEDVQPATGDVEHFRLLVLPQVRFTLPVLLVVFLVWFAWRIVNVPAFADFLIATEAEMNKVSWATRRQLIQDTVVVLVTVVMMTVFLLFADVLWSQVLRGIGVLKTSAPITQQVGQDVPW